MGRDGRRSEIGDAGFTLVEIIVAIVLVGVLSAVVVVGVGNLAAQGSEASCTASADAALAGAAAFWARAHRFPATLDEMTTTGSLELDGGVALDDDGLVATGDGWTLVMVVASAGARPQFSCTDGTPPDGFVVGPGGHFYSYVPLHTSWSDAAVAAATISDDAGRTGYLATVTSQAEHDAVVALLGGSYSAWIGGTDAAVEGEWRWAYGPHAGDAVTYTRWWPGEPNDDGDQDCIHLWQPYGYAWDDIACDWPYAEGYVVEIGG